MFFFPTTVVHVDPNREAFDVLQHPRKGLSGFCRFFEYSQAARLVISNYHNKEKALSILRNPECEENEKIMNAVQFILKDRNRFSIVSCVVSEHYLGSERGVDLMNSFDNASFRKILYTCSAHDKDIVYFFNEDLINKYVYKSGSKYIQNLKEVISGQEKAFFKERSNKHTSVLYAYLSNYDVRECYPLDNMGNKFLLITDSGEEMTLFKSSEYAPGFCEITDGLFLKIDEREDKMSNSCTKDYLNA